MTMESNAPVQSEGSEFSILEYFLLIRKHLKVIIMAGIIGAILGLVLYSTKSKVYQATARMKIDPFIRSSLEYGDSSTPMLGAYYYRAEYLNTEFQIMKSRNVLESVIERLGVTYFEENMPELQPNEGVNLVGLLRNALGSLVGEQEKEKELTEDEKRLARIMRIRNVMAKNIEIELVRDTSLVNIRFSSQNPMVSRDVTNVLLDSYLDYGLRVDHDKNTRGLEFIQETKTAYNLTLQDLLVQKAELDKEMDILNVGRNSTVDAERVSQLNQRMVDARLGALDAQEKYRKLNESTPSTSTLVGQNEVVKKLSQDLAALQAEFEGLKNIGPRHPTKVDLTKRMSGLQETLANEQRSVYEKLKTDLQAEVSGKEKTLTKLKQELRTARIDTSTNISDYNRKIAAIDSAIDAKQRQIEDMQRKEESYHLAILLRDKEPNRADRTIVEHALLPSLPYAPSLKRYVVLGIFLGGLLAVVLIVLMEITDRKIHSVEMLEKVTGLPNLALIPRIREKTLVKACEDYKTKTFRDIAEKAGKSQTTPATEAELAQIKDLALKCLEDEKSNQTSQNKNLKKIAALSARALKNGPHSAFLESINLCSNYAETLSPEYVSEAIKTNEKKKAQRNSLFPSLSLPTRQKDGENDEVAYGETGADKMYGLRKVVGCFTHIKPASPFSEAYRHLRTNIQLSDTNQTQIILLTSSVPGEGKTISSINLSIAFSQLKKRTLLIDGDLRRSKLHKVFGVSGDFGMVNYLVGQHKDIDSCVQHTFIPYLDLLAAGPNSPNPAELLASEKMINLVKTLRERYDFVIIDSSPVLAVTDSCIIGNLADATLFVSQASKTNREEAGRAMQILMANKIKPLGTLFNDLDHSRKYGYSKYGYTGGYGYGYGYGYSYKPEKA